MSAPPEKLTSKISFTGWIVIGIVAGVLCGLFFGEYTGYIKWMGDAFVGLLQMAVLPFVAASLVVNVGRLSLESGFKLLKASAFVLLILWIIGIVALVIASGAFPAWETGSFFSSRFTDEPEAANWMDLFIPSNPFRSFAENSIPAVVVFCIGLGIALMNLPNKEKLLGPLDTLTSALASLNKLVVKLTPIGMFAIMAYTAGTLELEQFGLIQGYLIVYGVTTFFVSFLILPALIAALTPLNFWQVFSACKDPLIAAFVIGNSFAVLPLIIEAIEKLQTQNDLVDQQDAHQGEYLVPLAYPFPDIGKIVGLIFIPFAAWFYGHVIQWDTYPALLGVGLLGSFGKHVITIPMLLDIAELPGDIFNLYLASGVVAARFGDLLKTMHLISFSILTICILNGKLRLQPMKLLVGLGGSIVLLFGAALLINGFLNSEFKARYSKENLVTDREMKFQEGHPVATTSAFVLQQSDVNPMPIQDDQSRVARIQKYGKLRVGYLPDRMPFSYFRADSKDLIGFDIQMAYYLAADLQVDVEFVPIEINNLHEQLAGDHFDVAMSAIEGTTQQAAQLPAIDAYMEVTLAMIVPDSDKRQFADVDQILEIPDLKIAVIKGSYFAERARLVFRQQFEVVEIDSTAEYFDSVHEQVHGLVISAENGSAWTIKNPAFTVVNPLKGRVRVPLYYLTGDDIEFENFLQNWLRLKKSSGLYDSLYDYWILGLDPETSKPRWSILRDVLGWVK